MISILFFVLIFICSSLAEKIYDYNRVDYVNVTGYWSFYEKYLDDFNRVLGNYIVGVASPECFDSKLMTSAVLKGAQRHAGLNSLKVFFMYEENFPGGLSHGGDCVEVHFYKTGTFLNSPTQTTVDMSPMNLVSFIHESTRTRFYFKNSFPYDVELAWVEESQDPLSQGVIASGDNMPMYSFLGHIFAAYRSVPNQLLGSDKSRILVDFMMVDGKDYELGPKNRLESCEIDNLASHFVANGTSCEDMDMRLLEFSNKIWHNKRLGLNYVQPKVVPGFSPMGFELRRLPESTYRWLKAWYDENHVRDQLEEGAVGPCMNQHYSPSTITHITPDRKQQLANELKPILTSWYGKGDLEMTSIYGIRKYTNGSVLRMHVDTVFTHVVSCIINVDQDVEEDWQMLILDHDDNEHWVTMKPGDMLLYESAKMLHGRPVPMNGTHYDNIFVHFQPVSGWDFSWV